MTSSLEDRQVEILLVEDNLGDARLVREVMKSSRVRPLLHHVTDGEEAMQFLRKQGRFSKMGTPDLILLDLNLPKMNGHETLREIKKARQLRRIPVLVLSVSTAPEDIQEAYDLHANCFIPKPIDYHSFVRIARTIDDFWLSTVRLPARQ